MASAGEVAVQGIRNDSGLSPEQLAQARKDLERLGLVGEDALRYVADGQPASVLATLAADRQAGQKLELALCDHSYLPDAARSSRRSLLNDPALPLPALRRLVEVYEAAARASRKHTLAPFALPPWLEVLLIEATGTHMAGYSGEIRPCQLTCDRIEQLADAFGSPRDVLVRAVFTVDVKDWQLQYRLPVLLSPQGWAAMLARHPKTVAEALAQKEAERKVHVLTCLADTAADAAAHAQTIVDMALGTAKTIRKAAERVLARLPGAASLLRDRTQAGSPAQRRAAVELLWAMEGKAAADFLRDLAGSDKGAPVRPVIEELLATIETSAGSSSELPPLPPVAPVEREAPLTPALRAALADYWHAAVERTARLGQNHAHYTPPAPLTDEEITQAIDQLAHGLKHETTSRLKAFADWGGQERVGKLAAHPDIKLVHVVRLSRQMAAGNDYWRDQLLELMVARYHHTHEPRISLRDLAAALTAAVHCDDKEVARLMLGERIWGTPTLLRLSPEAIWPYYAEHPDLLEAAWKREDRYSFYTTRRREMVFKILATFPVLPPQFVRLMWDIALNGTKKERPLAQAALEKVPGRMERLLATLASRKAEHRTIAAEWLGRIRDRATEASLRQALAKEKHEAAGGAMMEALEALGVPLDELVSTEGLLKEAKEGLAKGIPDDVAWLGLDRLPKVRWAHNDRTIPGDIIRWLLVASHKLNSPEPGPRLRLYASRFDRADAAALGQHVLSAWLAQDTIPPDHAAADASAKAFVAQMTQIAQWAQQHPQYASSAPPGNAASWYQTGYRQAMDTPVGSALPHRGVLAVAAACCGAGAARPVEQYLRKYYGNRVHQCKALVAMLAWVEHPSAVQVLLSVANRFRTAGIRKEAELRVRELADRKNWTLDELADRSIPTAGFEADLTLKLDYGPRAFTARLLPTLEIALGSPDGKPLKSLPEPRQDDDAEKAAAAKKTLSAAKKELASVVKLQKDRLYEAMCTQRTWKMADWNAFLHQHPIMRQYCQRLVWAVRESGQVTGTFRPMADGSLTDARDEPVCVPEDALISIAHGSLCGAEVATSWQQHLADYEIEVIFDQFGRGAFVLDEARRQETALADYHGYMTEAFKLRGRLTKAGYTRGPTGDGGWFGTYVKHFPTLRITAEIEFSGNGLPEENRPVALFSLSFSRMGEEGEDPFGSSGAMLALSEVPAVLLSECWHDYRLSAMDGPGFDPAWEKKVY